MTNPDVHEAIELINGAVRAGGQTPEVLTRPGVVEALEVIGCDIHARPMDQPVWEDIKPYVVAIRREPGRLTVTFDPNAAPAVAAFVAAEQQCCSEVAFSVDSGAAATMHVIATVALLDMVEGWMAPAP